MKTAEKVPYKRLLTQEALILDATETIWAEMERSGVRKSDLARRLNVSNAYVTQALDGAQNLTLRTLADFLWALDAVGRFAAYPAAFDESRSLDSFDVEIETQPPAVPPVSAPLAKAGSTSYALAA